MSKEVETMRKFLMAVAVLACTGSLALAGPNAGGTLTTHDASLLMSQTDGNVSICGQGVNPTDCLATDAQIDGATNPADPWIFKVYAAFDLASSPRLLGLTWGVDYDGGNIFPVSWGMCGDFELNDTDWPAPQSGSSVTYNTVQTGHLTRVYWFAAYTYGPGLFNLIGHPDQGGYFGDDTVPAQLDPICAYGSMGFDMPGVVACPPCGAPPTGACCIGTDCTIIEEAGCAGEWLGPNTDCGPPNPCEPPPQMGACCEPDGGCTETLEIDCLAPNVWQGPGTNCNPNLCPPPPNPVERSTWGTIKNTYR
jgi:hypothetical protein